jgi:hypothetical protein
LVWRDTVLGSDFQGLTSGAAMVGPTDEIRATRCELAITNAFEHLLDVHHNHHFRQIITGQHSSQALTKTYNVACDSLWTALKVVLQNDQIVDLNEKDRMAIYDFGWANSSRRGSGLRVNKALLQQSGGGCSIQISDALNGNSHQDKDPKAVFAELEKQANVK